MQSLILATSLVLSTPASISSFDNKDVLDEMVNSQVKAVSTRVSTQTRVSTRDTFLYQAKLAIQSGAAEMSLSTDIDDQAAE